MASIVDIRQAQLVRLNQRLKDVSDNRKHAEKKVGEWLDVLTEAERKERELFEQIERLESEVFDVDTIASIPDHV